MYNIICDSLCLNPKPNNGTLRLPLKPVGLHSPETAASEPSDPVDPTATTDPGTDAISISPIEASSAADPNEVPPGFVGVDPIDEEDENPPVEGATRTVERMKKISKGFGIICLGSWRASLSGFRVLVSTTEMLDKAERRGKYGSI